MHDFDYFYSRFPLEHNSMRLIVLIRSFNPRRTQFILQNIETRGKSFNPRAHTGRDAGKAITAASCSVSIHAPTRGATSDSRNGTKTYRGFNPRAHTGRDSLPRLSTRQRAKFQSTRPHGARLSRDTASATSPSFNPRAHTGRDST